MLRILPLSKVVAADEKEAGLRATLNLGHTFGHAIEVGFATVCTFFSGGGSSVFPVHSVACW